MRAALDMGLGGIPLLNEWNTRALDLFCRNIRPIYEKHPYLGAEHWRLIDIRVDSRAEARALLAAWNKFYVFFERYNYKVDEIKRKTNSGKK